MPIASCGVHDARVRHTAAPPNSGERSGEGTGSAGGTGDIAGTGGRYCGTEAAGRLALCGGLLGRGHCGMLGRLGRRFGRWWALRAGGGYRGRVCVRMYVRVERAQVRVLVSRGRELVEDGASWLNKPSLHKLHAYRGLEEQRALHMWSSTGDMRYRVRVLRAGAHRRKAVRDLGLHERQVEHQPLPETENHFLIAHLGEDSMCVQRRIAYFLRKGRTEIGPSRSTWL